jgi:tRNA G10  N-methylase Trm11
MVAACRRNGVRNAHVADIRSLHTTDRFDAIATDMPYGRGSLLKGKKQDVYEAAFEKFAELLKPGGYAAVMSDRPLATRRLHLVEAHRMRVHRSLDRYITVFRRLA